MNKRKIIILKITLVFFFAFQIIFFGFYFYQKNNLANNPSGQSNTSQNSDADKNTAGYEDSDNSDSANQTVILLGDGKLTLVPRDPSSLETTLASHIPDTDKLKKFVWNNNFTDIDISQVERASIENFNYEFNIKAHPGKFLGNETVSYILDVQIPPAEGMRPVFKWFLFDANMQVIDSINLVDNNLSVPGKIVEIKDYDNDKIDEILLETVRYIDKDNIYNPRFMIKPIAGKTLKIVWKEEGASKDVDTGRCSSSTRIYFGSSNPNPDDPELLSIQKVYTSKLSSGSEPAYASQNPSDSGASIIINNVTSTETKEYPTRQARFAKTLDQYYYSWDLSSQEFVYFKKESSSLDVNID